MQRKHRGELWKGGRPGAKRAVEDMRSSPRKIGAQIANAQPAGVKNRLPNYTQVSTAHRVLRAEKSDLSAALGRPSTVSKRPGTMLARKNAP